MDMAAAADPEERINNGTIIQCSRRCPRTKRVADSFRWQQMVTPWHEDEALGDPDWRTLRDDNSFTGTELLQQVNRFPRLYQSSMHLVELDPDGHMDLLVICDEQLEVTKIFGTSSIMHELIVGVANPPCRIVMILIIMINMKKFMKTS